MSEWMPIETLPPPADDMGALFHFPVVFEPSFGAMRDYVERCELWIACNGEWVQSGTGHSMDELSPEEMPTHWMPLPPPPSEIHENLGEALTMALQDRSKGFVDLIANTNAAMGLGDEDKP